MTGPQQIPRTADELRDRLAGAAPGETARWRNLHVPDLPDGIPVSMAALLYAEAGWFVLPVNPAGKGKHPGSLVGDEWQHQSSRDPDQLAEWWQRWPFAALALHTGRSGAVVFDVDCPANVPPILREHWGALAFQSTRSNDPERGHYMAGCVPMQYGCSLGDLRTDESWGEVKSGNSVIIAQPSPHPKAAEGGRYLWIRR